MEQLDLMQLWEQYHMTDLQGRLGSMFPAYSFSLEDMLSQILSGDVIGAFSDALSQTFQGLTAQLAGMRNVLLYLIILGIVSALLAHFTEVFENHQVADMGFFLVYLFLMAVLLRCFKEASAAAGEAMKGILDFIRVFIPTYYVAVGISGSMVTAGAGYSILLLLIYGIEKGFVCMLLPAVSSYVMLAVINGIWPEERLGILLDFLYKGISLILKGVLGIVTGAGLLQSLVTPVIDSIKSSALQKTVSMIPGIGNVADGVAEVVMGSAVLIKNSIGLLGVILLFALSLAPLVKIFAICFCLKLGAALMGVISDKRITGCTNKVGAGSFLVLKMTAEAMLLFILVIAVTAYTTSRGYI